MKQGVEQIREQVGRASSRAGVRLCLVGRASSRAAFTLIEMIGVLAVLALVGLLVVPATLRHLDLVAAEQETARLRTLANAFEQSVRRTATIPAATNWVAVVSRESGLSPTQVSVNPRRNTRVLLYDPSGWLSTNLPYTQNEFGTSNSPLNARVALLSSIGPALPISSGLAPSAAAFDAVWNWRAGSNGPPAHAAWNGWTGADDLIVERVNLSPSFVRLALTTYNSETNGQYRVGNSALQQVPFGTGFVSHFLKGTVLKLYRGAPGNVFDATQVLNADSSFVFESGEWHDAPIGRVVNGVGDVSGVVAAFLAAPPNQNAQFTTGNTQQVMVVESMVTYLSNYNVWAAANFPNGTLKTTLENNQKDLMKAVWGLYREGGGYNHYPTNNGM